MIIVNHCKDNIVKSNMTQDQTQTNQKSSNTTMLLSQKMIFVFTWTSWRLVQVKTKNVFCERSIVVFLWFLFVCVWSCVMFGFTMLSVYSPKFGCSWFDGFLTRKCLACGWGPQDTKKGNLGDLLMHSCQTLGMCDYSKAAFWLDKRFNQSLPSDQ